jgi:hypothetical protein
MRTFLGTGGEIADIFSVHPFSVTHLWFSAPFRRATLEFENRSDIWIYSFGRSRGAPSEKVSDIVRE